MPMLRQKYKTYEGARRRAAFENMVAPGEFQRGQRARLYTYAVVQIDGMWRVERRLPPKPAKKGGV